MTILTRRLGIGLGILGLSISFINAGPKEDLKNNQWQIVGGSPELQELFNQNITLTFTDNIMSIQGGCNVQNGAYFTIFDRLIVREMASTMMACDSKLMRKDQLSAQFFDLSTSKYTINNTPEGLVLKITNPKRQVLDLKAIH
ncbi:MAG: META domain-containing protein [Neisseriaceae bacterium]|nr:META domain-containing protein [Neisseriaceae bacterium PsAf]MCV2508905.1 META domain-containing protein [Neisseriaceae bacterium]